MAGGGSDRNARIRHSWHVGGWGNPNAGGGQPGKGITQYALSSNRQRPFAGFFTKGLFNSFRRVRNQILYVAPPFIIAYSLMEWAVERNEYLNSKPGRAEFGGDEE